MTEPTSLGTTEGHLCGHIAASLSVFIADRQHGGEKGCRVRFLDMSAWSSAERALNAIGVMQPAAPEDVSARHGFVFSKNAEEMPLYLATAIQKDDPRVPVLLAAFIGIACGCCDPRISVHLTLESVPS